MENNPEKEILIVEDEPMISSYISHVLTAFSFPVVGCSSTGSEALALADEHKPRLAVVDIQIAGTMDGIEVARRLRDRFGVQAIFLSGVKDRETIRRAREICPTEILQKPFLPSELLDAIERTLSSPRQPAPLPQARPAVLEQRLYESP